MIVFFVDINLLSIYVNKYKILGRKMGQN